METDNRYSILIDDEVVRDELTDKYAEIMEFVEPFYIKCKISNILDEIVCYVVKNADHFNIKGVKNNN